MNKHWLVCSVAAIAMGLAIADSALAVPTTIEQNSESTEAQVIETSPVKQKPNFSHKTNDEEEKTIFDLSETSESITIEQNSASTEAQEDLTFSGAFNSHQVNQEFKSPDTSQSQLKPTIRETKSQLKQTSAISPEIDFSHRSHESAQPTLPVQEKLISKDVEKEKTILSPTSLIDFSRASIQATDLALEAIADKDVLQMASDTNANPSLIAQAESATTSNRSKQGLYISFAGAYQDRASAQDFIGIATFYPGPSWMGAVGYRIDNFRIEGEYSYFRNDFDKLTFFTPGTTTASGPAQTSPGAYVDGRAIMFNAYYDIPINGSSLKPYIGGGLGFYNAHIVNLSPPGFGGFVANGFSPDRFAFQLRAGLNYAISRKFDIFLGYRYFQGNRFRYTIDNSSPPLVLRPNGLESHNLELGVRYNF
jgi:opacity protein-like surface antigen